MATPALGLALRQSEWRRVNARNISFETFYGGQFTLSAQLIILNYLRLRREYELDLDKDLPKN